MVYAVYQGDTNYEPSSTGTITQMVMSTAPAAPVKRATPIPAHPKKAAPKPKPKAQASSGAEAQGTSGRQAQSAFSYQAAGGRSRQDACQTGSGPDETVGMMCPSSWPQSAIGTWLSPSFLLSRCGLLFPKWHSKWFR